MGLAQLMLIKKAMENQKTPNQSQSTEKSEKKITSSVEDSFLLHLLEYIDNDEFSKNFFLKLSDYVKTINNKRRLNLCNEIQEFSESFYKLISETKMKKENLKKIVQLTDDDSVCLKAAPFKNSKEGQGIGGIGFYGWTNSEKFGITFNGVKLTKEMLESGENPYQVEYDKFQKDSESIKKQIDEYAQALLFLKSKKTFFKRKEKLQQIKLLEQQIAELNNKLSDDSRINILKDIYSKFTEEEKKYIKDYLDLVDKCDQCSKILLQKIEILCNYNYSLNLKIPDVIKKVVAKLLSDGIITTKEISDVISKLSSENIKGIAGKSFDPYKYSDVVQSFYTAFVGDLEKQNQDLNNKNI